MMLHSRHEIASTAVDEKVHPLFRIELGSGKVLNEVIIHLINSINLLVVLICLRFFFRVHRPEPVPSCKQELVWRPFLQQGKGANISPFRVTLIGPLIPPSWDGINTPMDEDSILRIAPPVRRLMTVDRGVCSFIRANSISGRDIERC